MADEIKPKTGMFAPDDPNDTMFQMPTSPIDLKDLDNSKLPSDPLAMSHANMKGAYAKSMA